MTTETQDWTTMPAGRDLDRLVHEQVLGRCAHLAPRRSAGHDMYGFSIDECEACGEEVTGVGFVAWYSASWDNAERVVEAMRARGYWLSLDVGPDYGGTGQAWRASFDTPGAGSGPAAYGGTAPLAICRAALAACAP